MLWHNKAVLCVSILEYEDLVLKIRLFIILLHQMIIYTNFFIQCFRILSLYFMRVNFILLLHEEEILGILTFIATTRSIKRKSAGNAELSKSALMGECSNN
jgi:hypothetical protein